MRSTAPCVSAVNNVSGGRRSLEGMLWELPRKAIEPMSRPLEGAKPHAVRAMPQVLKEGAWDDATILNATGKMGIIYTCVQLFRSARAHAGGS